MARRTRGQQHLLGRDHALRRVQAVHLPLHALQPVDTGVGANGGALALGCLGQPVGKTAHVHLRAALVQQAAVKTLALHLGAHTFSAQHFHIGVHTVRHQAFHTAVQCVHLVGARGQLELAVAQKVAIDGLLLHQARHGVYRIVVSVVPGAGLLHPTLAATSA